MRSTRVPPASIQYYFYLASSQYQSSMHSIHNSMHTTRTSQYIMDNDTHTTSQSMILLLLLCILASTLLVLLSRMHIHIGHYIFSYYSRVCILQARCTLTCICIRVVLDNMHTSQELRVRSMHTPVRRLRCLNIFGPDNFADEGRTKPTPTCMLLSSLVPK